ncbi:UNVERIFIED_CONTAM: hypothetical protein GTU68_028177, partial [Idotea baltica]|nr:hypothetical protein [Idotea baltica]
KKYLVTAGLPYSNGDLHVGHLAGAYVPSDIFVRFLKLCKANVKYICGSDDHGVPIMLSAEKEGKKPEEIAAHYQKRQGEDFKKMGINFDIYSSTSQNPHHKEFSQFFFKKLHEKGFFEKKSSKQFYDPSSNMFLPDRYVKGTCGYCGAEKQNSDQCENCGKILDVDNLKDAYSVITNSNAEVRETVHWFLSLSDFEKQVTTWLDTASLRDHTKNFVKGLVTSGLVTRAMTRDLKWGIPVPLEDPDAKDKVLYVWFDAPIGYISNTAELLLNEGGDKNDYETWWKSKDSEIVHFIGEDNTIFHCLIWIAMLSAEGSYELPSAVVVNQFLNFKNPGEEVEKISKSRGTAVWINEYLAEGNNPDSLRYYLTSIAPEKARTVYNGEDLISKHNSDLVNTLGNFVNRVLSFTKKHVGEEVPEYIEKDLDETDIQFKEKLKSSFEKCSKELLNHQFKNSQETIFEAVRAANKYIDDKAPWKTRKTDMKKTEISLAVAIEAIGFFSIVLSPFIPFTALKLQNMLNLNVDQVIWSNALNVINAKHTLGETVLLFAKIE